MEMNEADLISRLNWFYSLEATQVDNYVAQSKMVQDRYISLALTRFACIEQTHVDNITEQIRRLGCEPTQSREAISSSIGKLIGSVTPSTGIINMLKLDVAFEQKAKTDYKKLIDEVTDKELLQTLWSNLVDEDLHTAWMLDKINYLTMENEKRKLKI
jgi:bacterioferritin